MHKYILFQSNIQLWFYAIMKYYTARQQGNATFQMH